MSISYKLMSHRKEGQAYEDGQRLVDHLRGVSRIAEGITTDHGIHGEIKEVIRLIALCHDFGKASQYFQDYLKGTYHGKYKNHGEISAYLAYYLLPERWKLIGFMSIKKHHGNLEPDLYFFDVHAEDIRTIARSIEKNKNELESIYQRDLGGFFHQIQSEEVKFLKEPRLAYRKKLGRFTLEDYVNLNYIWSTLLTADKSQLINQGIYQNTAHMKLDYIEKYKDQLIKKILVKEPGIEKTDLFTVRHDIFQEAMETISEIDLSRHKIFSINVPTGTGKTLTAYGTAFKLQDRINRESQGKINPSIIYTLPFTSVIDQNYNVLEEIMDINHIEKMSNIILKHHSMTEIEYFYRDKTMDEAKEYRNFDARFCVENWQSNIITTTFVQLFNTMFKAGKNSIIHRFHKLAGSIIILDEIQAIPPKYYTIIEEIFNILCQQFHCYLITLTATKPLFLEGIELVKSNERYYRTLDRIEIHNHLSPSVDLEEFCQILAQDMEAEKSRSFLIVLNTIKSSKKVLKGLGDMLREKGDGRKLYYLSTEIHPARRLEIIKGIKEMEEKCILVSTQLIEAGVDIDFDIVYRDFAPIDSINQTAGRANRNAVKDRGIVKLFTIHNSDHGNNKYARYIYPDTLLNATERILRGRTILRESDIFDINQQYFQEVDRIRNEDATKEIQQAIHRMDFKKLQGLFQLIQENYQKEDIIINYNEEAQQAIDMILHREGEYQDILNAWRRLNKYKVSVDKKDLDQINFIPMEGMNVLDKKDYDENIGIKRTSYDIF